MFPKRQPKTQRALGEVIREIHPEPFTVEDRQLLDRLIELLLWDARVYYNPAYPTCAFLGYMEEGFSEHGGRIALFADVFSDFREMPGTMAFGEDVLRARLSLPGPRTDWEEALAGL